MDNKFLGSGWSFPPKFFDGGANVQTVSGEEDIQQSLQVILTTSLQERLMHFDFGCNLKDFLFETMSQGVMSDIKEAVSDAILTHESRIDIENIALDNVNAVKGLIHIQIEYKIRMTNSRFNYVFPFYLNEVFN